MTWSPRRRYRRILIFLLVLLVLPATTAASAPAPRRILVGEYSGYSFPGDIDRYTAAAGVAPSIVMWFQSWDEPLYYSYQMKGVAARGVTPLITWSPGPNFQMADLLHGRYDSYIVQQAELARAWAKPLLIRPFHEMNGTWQSFGPDRTTPAEFVRGWRRVVDLFRSHGATNVSWVWTPNVTGFGHTTALRPLYPGDDYTDWVGLDGYNSGKPWMSWRTLFMPSYQTITSFTTKPFVIAEWGSTERGGDKAAWITDFFRQLPTDMPKVAAVVSFSRVAEEDFRINSSVAALAAYRAALRDNVAYVAG